MKVKDFIEIFDGVYGALPKPKDEGDVVTVYLHVRSANADIRVKQYDAGPGWQSRVVEGCYHDWIQTDQVWEACRDCPCPVGTRCMCWQKMPVVALRSFYIEGKSMKPVKRTFHVEPDYAAQSAASMMFHRYRLPFNVPAWMRMARVSERKTSFFKYRAIKTHAPAGYEVEDLVKVESPRWQDVLSGWLRTFATNSKEAWLQRPYAGSPIAEKKVRALFAWRTQQQVLERQLLQTSNILTEHLPNELVLKIWQLGVEDRSELFLQSLM